MKRFKLLSRGSDVYLQFQPPKALNQFKAKVIDWFVNL
jgi:hypothetical protein